MKPGYFFDRKTINGYRIWRLYIMKDKAMDDDFLSVTEIEYMLENKGYIKRDTNELNTTEFFDVVGLNHETVKEAFMEIKNMNFFKRCLWRLKARLWQDEHMAIRETLLEKYKF